MLSKDIPNIWNIHLKGNMEIEMEVEFEKFLFAISEHTKEDMDKITVFRFDSLVDFIIEKNQNNGNN